LIANGYKTAYNKKKKSEKSWQTCTAISKLYETGDEDLVNRYWIAKESKDAEI